MFSLGSTSSFTLFRYLQTLKLAVSLHVNFKGNVSRYIYIRRIIEIVYVHEKYVKRYLHIYLEQYDLVNIAIYAILPVQLNVVHCHGKYQV